MRILSTVIITALILTVIAACSTSPTGRSQVKLFSSDRLNSMGSQTFASLKTEQKVSNKRIENQYVRCIADALIPFIPADTFDGEWEVVVFDNEQINAFALPGGKIGVYTGILNVAKTPDQLASVMGHEIGHVIAEHGNERMSIATLSNLGLQITNVGLKSAGVTDSNQALMMAGAGLLAQYGVNLPFSRAHESESDLIGLQLMAKAGFDPNAAPQLWENMAVASAGKIPPEWQSTHPSHDTRIADLKAAIPSVMADYLAVIKKPNCKP
jgi:predicted Zn-dependent protease